MDSYTINIKSPLQLVLVLMLLAFASSDDSKDKEECAESLVGLATCLPYVGGTAKSPTPDCCSGLKQVLNTKKKCLCVIIKDRNDPDLGLNINVTLALGLPQVCNAPANVSQCPGKCPVLVSFGLGTMKQELNALLNLPPNSPDAQIFYQIGQKSSNNSSSPVAGGPNDNGKPHPTNIDTPGSIAQQKSGGSGNMKRHLGVEIFSAMVFLLSCVANFVM